MRVSARVQFDARAEKNGASSLIESRRRHRFTDRLTGRRVLGVLSIFIVLVVVSYFF